MKEMYLFYFYVPRRFKERVKKACFGAGAGKIGAYSSCCFEFTGSGQFQGMDGSNAFIGKIGKLTKVSEIKVEMVVEKKFLKGVTKALHVSHPYEEPAFGFLKIFTPKSY